MLSIATAVWKRRFGWRHGIAVVGVVYGVAHFLIQRKGWEYHLYPLGIFAAVLAFSEVERLLEDRPPIAGVFVAAALAATVLLVGWRGWDAANAAWIWDKERMVRLLVHDVAARRKPGDRMQVFDTTEGGVHALLRLGMQQPTRFLYDFHFFHDVEHPTVQRLRAELVRDLAASPPRFVAVFDNGWPAGKLDRIKRFPALAQFLEADYAVAERRAGYLLLEKRQRP
ncbi:MAG: hypothetical protein HYU41_04350 [Candidatus Rokubacteria bacterium]|nr:hypothetical protein [Candidatus Rokubacteria bacterium]